MMGKSVERRAVSRVYDFRKNRDTESALRKVSVMKAVWTFLNYLIFERCGRRDTFSEDIQRPNEHFQHPPD